MHCVIVARLLAVTLRKKARRNESSAGSATVSVGRPSQRQQQPPVSARCIGTGVAYLVYFSVDVCRPDEVGTHVAPAGALREEGTEVVGRAEL